jgi:hypothetical protein
MRIHWGRDWNPARCRNICPLPCVFSCCSRRSELIWRPTKESRRVFSRLRRGKAGRKSVWIAGYHQYTRRARYRWANLHPCQTDPRNVTRWLTMTSCWTSHIGFIPTLSHLTNTCTFSVPGNTNLGLEFAPVTQFRTKVTASWNVTPCILVDRYQRFGGPAISIFRSHYLPFRRSLRNFYVSTKLRGVTFQKTEFLLFTKVGTSKSHLWYYKQQS